MSATDLEVGSILQMFYHGTQQNTPYPKNILVQWGNSYLSYLYTHTDL